MFYKPSKFKLRLVDVIDHAPASMIGYGLTAKLYSQTDKLSPACHQVGDSMHLSMFTSMANLRLSLKGFMNKYEVLHKII
jgi:hypothetical protein